MKKGSRIRKIFSLAAVFSCIASLSAQSVSEKSNANLEPVRNFELERYLGKWYEIGRFDFKWEKKSEKRYGRLLAEQKRHCQGCKFWL